MVVQATAYGIDKPGVSQQVAVKMLKGQLALCPLTEWNAKCYWGGGAGAGITEADVALVTHRETPDSGEGGSDVRAEDADTHRPPCQHC